MPIKNKLCWFRTDLRVHDNPALSAAANSGTTLAVFIISPEQWLRHGDAPAKVDFWLRALHALRAELSNLGIPLKILHIDRWSTVPAALLKFAHEHNIDEVHCNRENGINERNRDRASFKLLQSQGIALIGHQGTSLFKPGTIKTGGGSYYRVFTPFAKACRSKLYSAPYQITPCPAPQSASLLPHADDIPDTVAGFAKPSLQIQSNWPVDAEAIEARVEHFLDERINTYHLKRDLPALDGTSQLSAYLAAGLVSAGQCLVAALNVNQGELDSGNKGVTTWINELLWREFYQHLLHGFPGLSMHQPMRTETLAVKWRDSPEDFQAWCEGRTGVPLVDAAMRQLLSSAWMHNRLRMVVAMFLTKNLLIDWRLGEAFFMKHLIDGELGANNGGWQWSASTGADSAPYFRVFNPVSQSEKFDPEGTFIKTWLPSLQNLSAKEVHDPNPVARQACDYPAMIVDLKSSRLRAIAAFSSTKEGTAHET